MKTRREELTATLFRHPAQSSNLSIRHTPKEKNNRRRRIHTIPIPPRHYIPTTTTNKEKNTNKRQSQNKRKKAKDAREFNPLLWEGPEGEGD